MCTNYQRDKIRVADARKKVSSFEIFMFAIYGPHSWFLRKAKKQFLGQIGCFFYNKSKILTILFIVKYEKITHYDEFLVLLRPIISRFLAYSNEEKNKQKQQRVLALVLSLC
jgi:hypothetical protein